MMNRAILEGWLMKKKEHGGTSRILFGEQSKRWFRIQKIMGADEEEMALCYYVSDSSSEPKGWLFLRDIAEVGEYGDHFKLVSSARTLHLEAKTRAEHRLWVQAIIELCPSASVELSAALAHLKVKSSVHKENQRNTIRVEQKSEDDDGNRGKRRNNDGITLQRSGSRTNSEDDAALRRQTSRRLGERERDGEDNSRERKRDGVRYESQGATERLHGHIRRGVAEDDNGRRRDRRNKDQEEEDEEDNRGSRGPKNRLEKTASRRKNREEEEDEEEEEEEVERRRRRDKERARRRRQQEEEEDDEEEEEEDEEEEPDDLEAEVLDEGTKTSRRQRNKIREKARRREEEEEEEERSSRNPARNGGGGSKDRPAPRPNKEPTRPRPKPREAKSESGDDEPAELDDDGEEAAAPVNNADVLRYRQRELDGMPDVPLEDASQAKRDPAAAGRTKKVGDAELDRLVSNPPLSLQAKRTMEDDEEEEEESALDFKAEKTRYARSELDGDASKPSRPPRAPTAPPPKPTAPKTAKPVVPASGVPMDKDFVEKDWDRELEEEEAKKEVLKPKQNHMPAGVRHDDDWLDKNFDDEEEACYGTGQI